MLLHDAEPREPAQHDVGPAVRQRFVLFDPPRTSLPVDGRTAVVVVLPSRTQQDHADHPRSGQGVRDHLAVARLEDVERKRDLRKQDDVGQREERDDRRNGRQESSAPVLGAPATGR